MVKVVKSEELEGKVAYGRIRILRAEWWAESPRFVLLRYSVSGQEQPKGLRLDLDKVTILDDVEDADSDKNIKSHANDIWRSVIQAYPSNFWNEQFALAR